MVGHEDVTGMKASSARPDPGDSAGESLEISLSEARSSAKQVVSDEKDSPGHEWASQT